MAVAATFRQVNHPFHAGKLPLGGLLQVTCGLIGAAAMAKVGRIRHYGLDKDR